MADRAIKTIGVDCLVITIGLVETGVDKGGVLHWAGKGLEEGPELTYTLRK
jgi:hypothetical protein